MPRIRIDQHGRIHRRGSNLQRGQHSRRTNTSAASFHSDENAMAWAFLIVSLLIASYDVITGLPFLWNGTRKGILIGLLIIFSASTFIELISEDNNNGPWIVTGAYLALTLSPRIALLFPVIIENLHRDIPTISGFQFFTWADILIYLLIAAMILFHLIRPPTLKGTKRLFIGEVVALSLYFLIRLLCWLIFTGRM